MMKREINTKQIEQGITLIALVVTIVVLLILASVTISLLFSEKGIITKAREAAEQTNQATINEQTQLNDATNYIENILNELSNEDNIPQKPELPQKWDGKSNETVTAVESEDIIAITVPIPKGYSASKVTGENTVENGFVIYEGEEEVNDSNKDTAQTTRNQFVWVPVEKIEEMYGVDNNGKIWGKLYSFSEEGITPLNWTENGGIIRITAEANNREPDVVTETDTDEALPSYGVGASTQEEFKKQLETEFYSMLQSVAKYGGFYIGRYETGNLGQTKALVIKNNTDIRGQTWYNQYKLSKTLAANNNVTSTMIWGCQWDMTLRWMYNSGDAEKKTYTYDSTNKGNYVGTNGNRPIPTGSNDSYAVDNIYDMAGNVRDWTIEAYSTKQRVYRGGYCDKTGDGYPTSSRANDKSSDNDSVNGSRASLYINL